MRKILAFLTKRQDLETKAFVEHYETKHVPLIGRLAPAPLVYKRNYLVRGDALNVGDGSIDFDVVTELVFADRDAYFAWTTEVFKPGAAEQVIADEERFLDRTRTRAFAVEEYVIAKNEPLRASGSAGAARWVPRARTEHCGARHAHSTMGTEGRPEAR